jgi:hypothetical protein
MWKTVFADLDPMLFLASEFGIPGRKINPHLESGINVPDHIFKSLVTIF